MKTSPHWYDVIARWARCGKDIESLVKGKLTLLCLSWFLSSKSEGYLHGDLIWIKVESNEWYYAKKTNESRMSCLPLAHPPSSPPLPHGKYTEVQNDISSPPAPSPCASFSHPSSRLRRGTSARWAVLRRKRWPLADTWRWPLSPAQGPLHLNFSFKKGKGKSNLTYCRNAFNGTFEFPTCGATLTHHFMRNMSSPVESVAPIILSGSRPRAKPLNFSVWGSRNKIKLKSILIQDAHRMPTEKPSNRRQKDF